LAIFVPKIFKIGGNLTKLWQNNFYCYFETRCTRRNRIRLNVSRGSMS